MIPFNKPFIAPKEFDYIKQAVEEYHISATASSQSNAIAFWRTPWVFKKAC